MLYPLESRAAAYQSSILHPPSSILHPPSIYPSIHPTLLCLFGTLRQLSFDRARSNLMEASVECRTVVACCRTHHYDQVSFSVTRCLSRRGLQQMSNKRHFALDDARELTERPHARSARARCPSDARQIETPKMNV